MGEEECHPLLLPSSETHSKGSCSSFFQRLWRKDLAPSVPARVVLALMGFIGFVNVYALRINLSMAIVVMVNNSANSNSRLVYNWSSLEQGWVLSAFFYGYLITQIPGGYLASRFGGRYVFGLGILLTSVLTLLTPLAAGIHIGALLALRMLEGMFEGVTVPAMHALWGKWAPPKERSILTTFTYAGPFAGNVFSFPLSAVLCEYGFAGGWPSVFYVFGTLGVLWFILWLWFGFDSPSTHPRISVAERNYIESSIMEDSVQTSSSEEIPWFNLMTSPAVWGIIVAHFCFGWGGYTLLTCIPSYYKDALNLSLGKNLIQNGIFSAIPYAAFFLVAITSGVLADILRKMGLPTAFVRKIFNTTGCLLAGAGLIAVGYLGNSKLVTVSLMTFAVGFSGACQAGFSINHVDIAPQYAGVLMGITNTAGTIPGILGPLVAKSIAHQPSSGEDRSAVYQEEWREVFILAAEIYVFGALVYIILGEGRRQWWAGGGRGDIGKRIEDKIIQ